MPAISLPDGAVKRFDAPISVADVALSIGPGLAKAALAGKVDGKLVDTSYVIDHSGVSQDGMQKVRAWRTARAVGSVGMDNLVVAMNTAMGTHIDQKTARVVRRSGRYVSAKKAAR